MVLTVVVHAGQSTYASADSQASLRTSLLQRFEDIIAATGILEKFHNSQLAQSNFLVCVLHLVHWRSASDNVQLEGRRFIIN